MSLHQSHHNSIEDLQNKSLDPSEQIMAQLKILTKGQKALKVTCGFQTKKILKWQMR